MDEQQKQDESVLYRALGALAIQLALGMLDTSGPGAMKPLYDGKFKPLPTRPDTNSHQG